MLARPSEIAIGTLDGGVEWWRSFSVGSGFLADLHFETDPPTPAELDGVTEQVTDLLARIAPPPVDTAVAVGGSAASLRRLRGDLDDCTRSHLERTLRGVPQELHPLVEDAIRRVVGQVAHGPTRRLLEAAEAGEDELVEVLAGLFAASR